MQMVSEEYCPVLCTVRRQAAVGGAGREAIAQVGGLELQEASRFLCRARDALAATAAV